MFIFADVLDILGVQAYQHFAPFFLKLWLPFHIDVVHPGGSALLLQGLLEFYHELFFYLFVSLFFLRFTLFGVMVEDISEFTEYILHRRP